MAVQFVLELVNVFGLDDVNWKSIPWHGDTIREELVPLRASCRKGTDKAVLVGVSSGSSVAVGVMDWSYVPVNYVNFSIIFKFLDKITSISPFF